MLIFADDTTLLASGIDPAETSAQPNRDLTKISAWAQTWKVTFNAKKSKDMIFSNQCLNNSPPLFFNGVTVDRVNKHKHLGVIFQSNLDWSSQIHETCIKANGKLSVLRSVKMLRRKTLDLLYKVTVRSVVDYALPIYGNNLKQTELSRLEQLQYRAAKVVTGALHFTSRDKLNTELGWETIKKRIEYLGLSIFHKIHIHETRPLIRQCLSKLDFDRQHYLRSKGGYTPYPNFGNKFLNSFFPYISKIWNNLPLTTQSMNLLDFKSKLKSDLKPEKIKHYSTGPKESNSLLTRLRTDRTNLNLHRFTIGQTDDPSCMCHANQESSEHFMLDCFLFTAERQTLFAQVEQLIPRFPNLNKRDKFKILISGLNNDPDYYQTNKKLSLAVQSFILKTKRFSELYESPKVMLILVRNKLYC